jgi:uncharacterized YkwD family protein
MAVTIPCHTINAKKIKGATIMRKFQLIESILVCVLFLSLMSGCNNLLKDQGEENKNQKPEANKIVHTKNGLITGKPAKTDRSGKAPAGNKKIGNMKTGLNGNFNAGPNYNQAPAPPGTVAPTNNTIIQQVVDLTNQQRRQKGLPDLKIDSELTNMAQTKSYDMATKNYFSHTSPTYNSPFDMMQNMGIDYQAAAENIAKGQQSAEQVVNDWMNSPGHRQNILNPDFTHIGVGFTEEDGCWTQEFIKK